MRTFRTICTGMERDVCTQANSQAENGLGHIGMDVVNTTSRMKTSIIPILGDTKRDVMQRGRCMMITSKGIELAAVY
ncbi:MAG TPA: hypothetical protein VEH06_17860 [Candidatus Bathyarchaeia archaeon]|nr:hypothetical protein [Candidatus Bathyarchaeia archaeon]